MYYILQDHQQVKTPQSGRALRFIKGGFLLREVHGMPGRPTSFLLGKEVLEMPDRGGQRYDRSDSEPPVQGITFFKERQLSREQLFRDGSQSPDEIVIQSRSGAY